MARSSNDRKAVGRRRRRRRAMECAAGLGAAVDATADDHGRAQRRTATRSFSRRARSWSRWPRSPPAPSSPALPPANWASSSNIASPSRSPSAKTNPPCCPSSNRPSTRANCSIYSDHSSPHPTNAAELTNSTGKTLDGGPITVYDGGAYGGEALMETLKAGDKRLISYAVDLGTRITEAFGSKAAVVREIHANRGMLTVKSADGRDPHLYHPQCRSEGQNAHSRASPAPGLYTAQSEALRRRPRVRIASKSPSAPARRRNSWSTRSASIR